MPVQRVEENKSGLNDGIRSAIVGGALGYASKFALPLTTQEMDKDYQKIVEVIKENANRAKEDFMKEIKNLPERSLAQDAYVKSSEKAAKIGVSSYKMALKKIRPTSPFVVAGAVTGLMYSFVKNILDF